MYCCRFTNRKVIMKQIITSHFGLQRTRFNRASIEFGLAPIVSYALIIIIFCGLSYMLLSRGEIEQWEYTIGPIILIFIFSDPDRLRFYKQIYSHKVFTGIRISENLIITLPFLFFLIAFKAFIPSIIIFGLALIASILNRGIAYSISIPTPFYKYPFEFASGFRMSWLFLIVLYIIFSIAVYVDNSYLGIFTLTITALCSTAYYQTQEALYFIWIHKMDSKSFIIHKIKIAIGYTLLTIIPLLITAIIVWPYMTLWIVLFCICALLFIATSITAKYAIYPNIFDLPLTIALSIGFIAPPLLLLLLPYLFKKASQNLKHILS